MTTSSSDQTASTLASELIWRNGCQGGGVRFSTAAGLGGSAEGAAALADARRAVRLIFAGWVPQDRVSSGEPAL